MVQQICEMTSDQRVLGLVGVIEVDLKDTVVDLQLDHMWIGRLPMQCNTESGVSLFRTAVQIKFCDMH